MNPTKPKVLRRLKIDEFSFVDAPASVGSDVLVWKRAAGTPLPPPPPPAPLAERVAKLVADIAAVRANRRVDEVHEALAKRDTVRADELLRDRETHAAYKARLAGERWQPPVEVAKAEPDHRADIREAVASGDPAALTRLFRSAPATHGQYRGMLGTEELRAAAAEGFAKRSRTPADVPEAEVNRWKARIKAMLKAGDTKGLEAAKRAGDAVFQAAWIAMWAAGEKTTM